MMPAKTLVELEITVILSVPTWTVCRRMMDDRCGAYVPGYMMDWWWLPTHRVIVRQGFQWHYSVPRRLEGLSLVFRTSCWVGCNIKDVATLESSGCARSS